MEKPNSEIIIRVPDIDFLEETAKGIELNEEQQQAIFTLIALQERTAKAIDAVKKAIIKKGLELTPDFKGFVGDDIKAYVKSGEKYKAIDKKKIPDTCMKEITFKKLSQSAVNEYKKVQGVLPDGVEEVEEVKNLVFLYDKDKAKEIESKLFASQSLE
jgi:hypothetical protein